MTQQEWKDLVRDKPSGFIYFRETNELPEDFTTLTLDTRNFNIKVSFGTLSIEETRPVVNILKERTPIKVDFLIKKDSILHWIILLEQWSGGRGTFRHLSTTCPSIKDRTGWDLKAIRFYKLNMLDHTYIVCNKNSRAFKWREITENSIDKKNLSFYNSKNEK